MDRELSTQAQLQYRMKSLAKVVVPLIIIGAVAVYAGGLLAPSLESNRLRTATVQEGGIEGTIEASGVVVPEFDAVMTCPVEARVLRIVKRVGDSVERGEALLDLDVRGAELALEKLTDNIALKRNAAAQLKATLTAKLQQLENSIRIKRREIESDSNAVEQNRKLFDKGYLSAGELQKFIIQAKKSQDELDALLKDFRNAEISSGLQQEGVALEMAILQKDKSQSERELLQASTKAEQKGVVTWIIQTVGAGVRKGEMIARVADLSSYRIDATVSEVHRNRIAVGMPVYASVGAGAEKLRGFITGVQPSVENGTVKFTVALQASSHANLKPNMRVDIGVIIAQYAKALILKRGAYFHGEGATDVFVVRTEGTSRYAVKTRVVLGTTNSEMCEIRSGLQKGDVVVLNDMKDFQHNNDILIK
ncbi:MAG: efflux RND transporter periplasmic adaptor subunit [Candidatus Kapabacteria bacterium]|jgi:HlyD family secretion protein|nr:efflux RND transporter periplasmic adaptor subunit [Candidatus Kapabacteria bacterium]